MNGSNPRLFYFSLCFIFLLGISSCTITDTGGDPLENISNFTIGNQRVKFNAAKLTITGPINVSGPNSHVWARLDLSTDAKFTEPILDGATVMSIGIRSLNTGVSLPQFPLRSGDYIVFPSSGISDPTIFPTLDESNFSFGPLVSIKKNKGNPGFEKTHDVGSGSIKIQFDLENNTVKITHNWTTAEGEKAAGANNLPLNLSSFKP